MADCGPAVEASYYLVTSLLVQNEMGFVVKFLIESRVLREQRLARTTYKTSRSFARFRIGQMPVLIASGCTNGASDLYGSRYQTRLCGLLALLPFEDMAEGLNDFGCAMLQLLPGRAILLQASHQLVDHVTAFAILFHWSYIDRYKRLTMVIKKLYSSIKTSSTVYSDTCLLKKTRL
jgi:hypothetical protein